MKCLRCREEKERTKFPWLNKAWNIKAKVCWKCHLTALG